MKNLGSTFGLFALCAMKAVCLLAAWLTVVGGAQADRVWRNHHGN